MKLVNNLKSCLSLYLKLRNKLNQEQNTKLAAHREIFQQRKEEMARMDQRIAELQNRLRNKKLAAATTTPPPVNGTTAVPESRSSYKVVSRSVSTNIAAVEPYIQRIPQEEKKQSDIIKLGDDAFQLGKQDPKYRTLPYNIKFPGSDGLPEGKQDICELPLKNSGDMQGNSLETKSGEQPIRVSGPSVLSMSTSSVNNTYRNIGRVTSHFAPKPYGSYHTPVTNDGRSKLVTGTTDSPSVIYTGNETSPGCPLTSTPVIPANGPYLKSGINHNNNNEIFITGAPTVPSTKDTTSLRPSSQLASSASASQVLNVNPSQALPGGNKDSPSPQGAQDSRGSNHSASQIMSNRAKSTVQHAQELQPPSPASSSSSGHQGSSMGSSDAAVPPQVNLKNPYSQARERTMPPSLPATSSGAVHSSASHRNNGSTSYASSTTVADARPSSQQQQQQQQQRRTPYRIDEPPRMPPSSQPSSQMGRNGSGLLPTRNGINSAMAPPVIVPSTTSGHTALMSQSQRKDNEVDTSPPSVNTAISVLKAPPTTSSIARPSYHYAPKSVIANTYMTHKGTTALSQYRKTQTPGEEDKDNALDSPNSKVQPMTSGLSPLKADHSISPARGAHHYYYRRPHSPPATPEGGEGCDRPGTCPPPYPGVPPYMMDPHYKPNAPRPLRRRWSITEMDEHPKTTPSHKQYRAVSNDDEPPQPAPPPPDIIRVDHVIPGSFSGGSTTLQDTMKATAESSSGGTPSPSEKSGQETKKSEATKESVPVAIRRKKSNLKGKELKSSRRVSFDPLALLLDASLEGELELVKVTARQVGGLSVLGQRSTLLS